MGLTKIHFLFHSAKIFKKYDLVSLVIPFIVPALAMNLLPIYVAWGIFAGSSGYLLFLMVRRIKRRKSKKKKRRIKDVKSNSLNRKSGS